MPESPSPNRQRERRKFPRTAFRAKATLRSPTYEWPAETLDLSFRGALIAVVYQHQLQQGEEIQLSIELEESPPLFMYGQVAHTKGHILGLECRANGIEQQKMLRKLVHQSASVDYMNRSRKPH